MDFIDEIREKTRERIWVDKMKKYDIIKNEICNAAARGEWNITLDFGYYDAAALKKLKEEGFKVKSFAGEIDDYGYWYQGHVFIDWRPKKNGKKLFS